MKPLTLFVFILFITFTSKARQYRLKSITASQHKYFWYKPARQQLLFYSNNKKEMVPDMKQLDILLSGWGSYFLFPTDSARGIDSLVEYQSWSGKRKLTGYTIQKFDTVGRVITRVAVYRDEKNHKPFGPYDPCPFVNKQGYHCGGHDSMIYDSKGRISMWQDINDRHYTKRAYHESGGYTDISCYYWRDAYVPSFTYYIYDSLGRQQEVFSPNDTAFSIKYFYEQPNEWKHVTHIVYRYHNDTNHIVTSYDDKGRKTGNILYAGKGPFIDRNRKTEIIYRDKERIAEQFEWVSGSDTVWHYRSHSIYYYNEAGLPVKALRYWWNDKTNRWRKGLRHGREMLLLEYEKI